MNEREPKRQGMGAIVSDDFNLMDAVGGLRGIGEAIVPTLVFLIMYIVTGNLAPALIVALVSSGLLIVLRLLQRIDVSPALGGLFAIALSAFIAWRSGEASDFFLWGLVVNVAYGAAMLISILVRWPLIGVLVGAIRGEMTAWRNRPSELRRYTLVTWMWAGLFAARAGVQIPLYLADATEALGIARLIMGMPLFALVAWFSWLLLRDLARTPEQ